MNLIIRNVPEATHANISAACAARGITQQELLAELLESKFGNPPAVKGWIKLDRWGELDERDEPSDAYATCPECGERIDPTAAYVALLGDGRIEGPYCTACATSQ